MSFRGWFLLLLFLVGSGTWGFAAPPNIVLITLDTTRADRMGFLGSQRGLTPNLDVLARNGIAFTRAYSNVPITTASHASILTGTYPQFHHVNDAGVPLAKDLPYAPEILRRSGYRTAAFVGAVILDPSAGAPGFGRGFDYYDAGFRARGPVEDRYQTLERRGGDVVAHAVAWLDKHPAAPFFLWVHIYDPHAPYDPPEPFKSRYASQPYDGEIAYADSVVGKLLDQLRAKKLYDSAVIAVMADHGEALGEHGERGHGIFLYDPTIHVPLVLKLPAQQYGGKRVDARVSLVDVLPTVLQAGGIAIPKAVQGRSLLPIVRRASGDSAPDRPAYAESDYPHKAYGWSSLRALRTGKYLFVEAPRKELYDESSDPAADRNLSGSAIAVAETLTSQLHGFRKQTGRAQAAPNAGLDPQQEAKLRALGYVASGGKTPAGNELAGADPKDKIEIANQMTEANLAFEEARYQEAILKLGNVIATDPSVSAAYTILGSAWSALGNQGQAVRALRKAVELRPESVNAHYQLGMALFQAGDWKAAAPEFEAAVTGFPQSADMHYSLAAVYVRINRMDDAKKELQKSLRIKPGGFEANLMLGQILLVQKSPGAALLYLQRAAQAQPGSAEVHQILANAYTQLGQKAKSEQERALAERAKAAGSR